LNKTIIILFSIQTIYWCKSEFNRSELLWTNNKFDVCLRCRSYRRRTLCLLVVLRYIECNSNEYT